MGSGMSGGERGSRQGCRMQTHTHSTIRTMRTSKLAHTSETERDHLFPVCDFTLFPLSPKAFSTLFSPSSYRPASVSAGLGGINQIGTQIWKLFKCLKSTQLTCYY